MKKYVQPKMAIAKLDVESVLTVTSIYSNEVDGQSALGKRRGQDYWEEEWDEEF